ncbi:IMP dehydrogenase / GMP reductase, conserved site [Phytophthora cactorum]|nr:IMP dehydrogenase / GMP reductase, conserved site [Phytophthora cactorum]
MPRIETEVRLDFKDVDVQREFRFRNSKRTWSGVPVIAANMDTVGTFEMAVELAKLQFITCVHKHYTPKTKHPDVLPTIAVSGGSSAADVDKITAILKSHPDIRFICLDVANGYSEFFVRPAHIIAGNVVTGEMVEELLLSGADIIKVGIGPGSVCTTRKQTGVGYPQLSAVLECADAAHAFGAGADFVMLGGMLLIEINGKLFKKFYGMSSSDAMKKHNGGVAEYRASEGKSVTVPYRGPVAATCKEILGGVRSTCTYVGASKLKEISKRTTFIRVSQQLNEVFGRAPNEQEEQVSKKQKTG